MIDYSEENDLAPIDWRGNYQAAIMENQEAWCVANTESGDEVERCASKPEASRKGGLRGLT
jgi:hypothetical protein